MALGVTPWRVHATLGHTRANGPGLRYAVWVQGCTLACEGCFNPKTHSTGGTPTTTAQVFSELIHALPVDGVTITGGEPLQQPAALSDFLRLVKSDARTTELSVIVLSGYSTDEIQGSHELVSAIEEVDTVIHGRYNRRLHIADGLRGSSNKQYWHRTTRHDDTDFAAMPESEIVVLPDGSIAITGMHDATNVLSQ